MRRDKLSSILSKYRAYLIIRAKTFGFSEVDIARMFRVNQLVVHTAIVKYKKVPLPDFFSEE